MKGVTPILGLLLLPTQAKTTSEIEQLEKPCHTGAECLNLGFMYEHGRGVKQSDFEAVKYYLKACILEDGTGCTLLGFMYQDGRGVKHSDVEAVKYYRKACTLEDGGGCTLLGA